MTDARALLNRITAFRERLEGMPRLLPDKDVHPVPNVASKEVAAVEAKQSSPDLPADLGTRVRKCLDDARSLIAGMNELGQRVSVRESDVLRSHHADTASLLDGAVRMLRHYPEEADARWNWNTSLEVALHSVRQRLRELKLVAGRMERDRSRVDRLAEYLWKMHLGDKVDRVAFDAFVAEVADDFKSGPLHWSGAVVDRSDLARSVAAHSLDVARVVARLAPGLVPAALLCDVGMPAVNANQDVEAHVLIGVEMLRKQFPDAGDWIEAVEHHHERADGSGYPHGWKGDRVSYAAKLLAVADVYTRRVTGWPNGVETEPRTVLADLLLDAEKGVFDADAVQAMLAVFHPVGSVVELGDGSIAGVVAGPREAGNAKLFAKPVVQKLLDGEGEPLAAGEFIDLETAGGTIVRTVPAAERASKLGHHHLSWAV